MMLIELDIFSGRPNPRWILNKSEVKKFFNDFPDIHNLINVEGVNSRLGLRGLRIVVEPEIARLYKVPQEFWIGNKNYKYLSRSLEVIETIVNDLSSKDRLKELVAKDLKFIEEDLKKKPLKENKFKLSSDWDHIDYKPKYWNDNPDILDNNNCYAFATAKPTSTFAQPGRYHGYYLTDEDYYDCSTVKKYSIIDGLVDGSPKLSIAYKPRLHVALVIAPGIDYHWYREFVDSSGKVFWAHKPGSTEVTDKDNSGNEIYDPETADRGIYTIWCGFMIAARPLVRIR